MAEDWDAVALEVAGAIAEVGFAATLIRLPTSTLADPPQTPPAEYPITVLDDTIRIRDMAGQLTGETRRVLTIGATGVVPARGDKVLVRGVEHRIGAVMPLAPGGTDVLFDCDLEA